MSDIGDFSKFSPRTVLHWYDFLCPFCYASRNALCCSLPIALGSGEIRSTLPLFATTSSHCRVMDQGTSSVRATQSASSE
jgi:hypothetical protein